MGYMLCLTKVQFNLKAIHNMGPLGFVINIVVSDQGTIQFESDSQHKLNQLKITTGCV